MDFSNFKNVGQKEGEYYVAQSLTVDLSSFETSKIGALRNLREALELYFEDTDKKYTGFINLYNQSFNVHRLHYQLYTNYQACS